jgi:hypothetical protein
MKPAPFQMTSEAEAFFRSALQSTKKEMEPSIVWTPVSHSFTTDGKLLGAYEGSKIVFGWYKKGERPRDSFFELCGHPVSIMPTTLEHIQGRTISFEKVQMHFEGGPHEEYVLKVG